VGNWKAEGVSEVTRDEFSMLREQVNDNARRIEAIDQGGTRGVAVLAVQVSELTKDVGQVQHQLEEHHKEHEKEAKARVTARRWAIGLAAGLFAAVESPLVTLLLSRH
jgi:hypothetical protein